MGAFTIFHWLVVLVYLAVFGIPMYLACRLMWAAIKRLETLNGGK